MHSILPAATPGVKSLPSQLPSNEDSHCGQKASCGPLWTADYDRDYDYGCEGADGNLTLNLPAVVPPCGTEAGPALNLTRVAVFFRTANGRNGEQDCE